MTPLFLVRVGEPRILTHAPGFIVNAEGQALCSWFLVELRHLAFASCSSLNCLYCSASSLLMQPLSLF
nr:MAG TPA: hypothetical protein [Caudoviricetes sp.]